MAAKTKLEFEPLLDAQDVARLLKCSLSWVYSASGKKLLPSICIPAGKKTLVRFKKSDVFQLIENHYQA